MKRLNLSIVFFSLLAIAWNFSRDARSNAAQTGHSGVSGQGKMKFRVLYTSDHLPPEAQKVLTGAHGGFC